MLETPTALPALLPEAGIAPLQLHCLQNAPGRAAWEQLSHGLSRPGLFCSWPWVETWLRHYGAAVPHEFVAGKIGEEIVGITLLTRSHRSTGPISVRGLHMGTAGERDEDSVFVEYNRLLVPPAHHSAFAAALMQMATARRGWDSLHLDGMTTTELEPFLSARPGAELRSVPDYWFDLQTVRDAKSDVLTWLGSNTRRSVRQALKATGEVTLDWAETPAEAESIFADLVRLHQARWQSVGKPGCYASRPFLEFHQDVIARLLPEGKVALTRVRQGERVLGCVQLFIDRNRLMFYQTGSERSETKASLGLLTDYLSMQAGLERGYDAYDFLAGDTIHKQKLSTDCQPMIWATWRRPRWKFAAIDFLRSVKHRYESWRKPAQELADVDAGGK